MLDTKNKPELIKSLKSNRCPACGASKRQSQTFCGACYHELPAGWRHRLYNPIGKGYEQAVNAAQHHLRAATERRLARFTTVKTGDESDAKPIVDLPNQLSLFDCPLPTHHAMTEGR